MIVIRHLPVEEIMVHHEETTFDIGSENCCLRFSHEIESFIEKSPALQGKKFRLVTPRVSQGYMKNLVGLILKIIGVLDIEAVIINDYGVLYELNKLRINKNFILGRLVIRCPEYEPHHQMRIHPEEDQNIIRNWLNPAILHTKKIELLKKMNFTGVELSATNSVAGAVKIIQSRDLKVNVHYNSYVGGLNRTCLVAREYDTEIGSCARLCDRPGKIKLANIEGKYDLSTDKEVCGFPDNLVFGNVVYFLRAAEGFPYAECDAVIFDARFNNESDMKIEYQKKH